MDSGSPLRYGRNDVFLIARLILKQSRSLNGFTERFHWDFLEDEGNREDKKRERKNRFISLVELLKIVIIEMYNADSYIHNRLLYRQSGRNIHSVLPYNLLDPAFRTFDIDKRS